MFQEDVDEAFSRDIYLEYYYSYPFQSAEVLADVYREPFEKVARHFFPVGDFSLLEVGCADEQQMRLFLDLGYRCTAVNPGAKRGKSVEMIDGFYGQISLPSRFDFVVSRFNLEHLFDLNGFFGALKKNLAPAARVIVQVPNIEYFLAAGYLNVFAHEHPQYFCRRSLGVLIERHGMEMLYLSPSDSHSLICCFAPRVDELHRYDPITLLGDSRSRVVRIQQWLSRREGEIVLYGAGLTATALLYFDRWPYTKVNLRVVDDNPIVQGRMMPNTDIAVCKPDSSTIPKGATILLTLSPQYYPRVLERLKAMGIEGEIFYPSADGVTAMR